MRMDWQPLLPMLVDKDLGIGARAGIFHESLARSLAEQVSTVASTEKFAAVDSPAVCSRTASLAERVMELLAARIPVYLPEIVPANDGGLAFGQLIEALHVCSAHST